MAWIRRRPKPDRSAVQGNPAGGQDTRYGRKVLAEATEIADIIAAVTHYVAMRLIERDTALAADRGASAQIAAARTGWRTACGFLLGLIVGSGAVAAALGAAASRRAH
jgi:hypothetical protein